jgi:hypothetical protein
LALGLFLLLLLRSALNLLAPALDVFPKPLHGVASSQAEGKGGNAQYGNDLLHDFSFLV